MRRCPKWQAQENADREFGARGRALSFCVYYELDAAVDFSREW